VCCNCTVCCNVLYCNNTSCWDNTVHCVNRAVCDKASCTLRGWQQEIHSKWWSSTKRYDVLLQRKFTYLDIDAHCTSAEALVHVKHNKIIEVRWIAKNRRQRTAECWRTRRFNHNQLYLIKVCYTLFTIQNADKYHETFVYFRSGTHRRLSAQSPNARILTAK